MAGLSSSSFKSSSSQVSTPSSVLVIATCCACVTVSSCLLTYLAVKNRYRKKQNDLERKWQQRRNEERTGRIRAEVKLRTITKNNNYNQQSSFINKANNDQSADHDDNEPIENGTSTSTSTTTQSRTRQIQIIGTVVSPYSKRMGCPRQPQLVPSSRGYIQFRKVDNQIVPPSCLDGIEQYSHLWIIFEFHANTNITNRKFKIRPPRANNGIKVGQLATRSPHRPNPIGLSLVSFVKWDASKLRLHISGLDLVNNTPVYDIKPCVPWDIVAFEKLKVPDWVLQDDTISNVIMSTKAIQQLQYLMINEHRLEPLYCAAKNDDVDIDAAIQTIKEILAQDPRSTHKGVDSRGKQSDNIVYSFIFGRCQIEFIVDVEGVTVTQLKGIDFDELSYVEGIPLISENKDK